MKTIAAGEFKARCLQVMDEVSATREPVVVTKRGRPVVKLTPAGKTANIFGCLAGIVEIAGDIESPVVAPEDWEALR